MGLDMYLTKRTFIGNQYRKPEERVRIVRPKDGDNHHFSTQGIQTKRISSVEEQVGYWRKANHIHHWFVNNVQNGEDDCKNYWVPREQLQQLLDTCKEVVKHSQLVKGPKIKRQVFEKGTLKEVEETSLIIKNPTKAKELLPVQEGFFFGATEYDDWYIEQTKETIKILEEALKEENGDFEYHSSW